MAMFRGSLGGTNEVDRLLADYFRRTLAGEAVDRADFLNANPDHADQLEEFFDDYEVCNELLKVSRPPTDSPVAVPGETTLNIEGSDVARQDPSSPQSRIVPAQLGDYRLIEEIGRGGMGVVYRAEDVARNRTVALKLMLSGHWSDDASVRRFRREAAAAARLNHPNIVSVYDVGNEAGTWYIAMELVRGKSLDQLIRDSPLQPARAARCAATIAGAVHYAHEEGVLHRDLKPSNVLIAGGDRPRITDFGLAKDSKGDPSLTSSSVIMGTPSYMAPEQVSPGRKTVTAKADVYAVGAILYECLTGRPPFRADTPLETLNQVCQATPAAPKLLNPQIPAELETICLKCLEKDPARRYESARLLAEDLNRFINGDAVLARPAGRLTTALRWCHQHPTTATLVGVAWLVFVTVVAVVAGHTRMVAGLNEDLEKTNQQLIGSLRQQREYAAESARLRDVAEDKEWALYQSLYAADMQAAADALRKFDTNQATGLIDRYARPGELDDVRGFEWYYLNHRARVEQSFGVKKDYPLYSVCLSGDGRWLALGGGDDRVELIRRGAGGGPKSGQLFTHQQEVNTVAFSPDSQLLATAGDDGTVRLWDVDSLTPQRVIDAVEGGPAYVARFTPDGKTLATAGKSPEVRLWNVADGRPVAVLGGFHKRAVEALDISRDGRWLVSASSDLTAAVWDLETSTVLISLGHSGRLTSAVFSPDGRSVISGSLDQAVRVWNASNGKESHVIQRTDEVQAVAVSPDGNRIAVADRGGSIAMFRLSKGKKLNTDSDLEPDLVWQAHDSRVYSLVFGSTNDQIVSASQDGSAVVWHVPAESAAGSEPSEAQRAFDNVPTRHHAHDALEFVPESEKFIHARTDRVVVSEGSTDNSLRELIQEGHEWESSAVSSDGTLFATGNSVGDICIFDSSDETLNKRINIQQGARVEQLEFFPSNNQLLVCTCMDGLVESGGTKRHLWSVNWQRNEQKAIAENCSRCAVSPNGRLVAYGSTEGNNDIFVIRGESGEQVARLSGHRATVSSLAFSRDGSYLGSASHDRTARLWDTTTWRQLREFVGSRDQYSDIAFSPDGRTLATCDFSGQVVLWQVATGRKLVALKLSDSELECLQFSPSGTRLAVVRHDQRVMLLRGPRAPGNFD